MGSLALGFDVGSVAVKTVVTDLEGRLLDTSYRRTLGRPVETAAAVLAEILARYGDDVWALVAGTGSAGRLIARALGTAFVNEVICQALAIRHLRPDVRTIIEMGGEDSKLIVLPADPADRRPLVDLAMNTSCAAGTGSFLDQQASRLGLRIEEEFGRLAASCPCPPHVAGRCSVFAKSDMIHLQQQGATVSDVVAGLCLGLARNLKANLGRGAELERPIAFCGGVAANQGVVHALETVFGLSPGELFVPECHACTGALGAVLATLQEQRGRGGRPGSVRLDLSPLHAYQPKSNGNGRHLKPLVAPPQDAADGLLPSREELAARAREQPIDAYLGVDVGSISTKAAVLDAQDRILAKVYLMTAGRPLDAVRRALSAIAEQVADSVCIRGAATTGSGRYLTGDFIGADLVINEITAQATAAAAIDREVDTIFEIGGQDSKYVGLDRGVVVDFEMNHACAAGTGSFLEEQAERLGINIQEQFGQLALNSAAPIRLGERCTVFMESDLLSHQQQNAPIADLAAGLSYSIVTNYLNRVVGHRRIGERIFFQGGTAFNQGVVAAFQKVTGRKVTVPPHHEVTGAIGAALLARRYQAKHGHSVSKFGGFAVIEQQYAVRSFECESCSNSCEIHEVTIAGREPLYYGSRCDRYNRRQERAPSNLPDLFAERQRLLRKFAHLPATRDPQRPTVGIPMALLNHQLLPFWGTLLSELRVNVVLSPTTNPALVNRGVQAVLATPCFPVKLAHGHVLDLLDRGVDYVWLPGVSTLTEDADVPYSQACPYVTSLSFQVGAALEAAGRSVRILQPQVSFRDGPRSVLRSMAAVGRELGASRRQLRRAVARAWQAQEAFEEACRQRGRDVLANLDSSRRAVVIVSRPYNGCDPGANLHLAEKLRRHDVLPVPMDFLDLRSVNAREDRVLRDMYWKNGQRILRAAEVVRADARLHAVYLSNFGCGPDSFLIGYFKRLMAPKPSLVLEIDEHSADAGLITRIEAFLESLAGAPVTDLPAHPPLYPVGQKNGRALTWYLPWMGDVSHGVAAALRAHGQRCEVIPVADQESLELGRKHCSGKECLPCIITTGDMLRITQRPDFDPRGSAFFMPGGAGPCRFGQYSCLQRLVLDDVGLRDVPVISPTQNKEFYEQLGVLPRGAMRLVWYGMCAFDVLLRACLAIRPYERSCGQTDAVYEACGDALCKRLESRPRLGTLVDFMAGAAQQFAAIPADRSPRRPRIGVVGENYVRHHRFANNDLVRHLERLGAEVTVASFFEYQYYMNWFRRKEAWTQGSPRHWLSNYLQDRVQRRIHARLAGPFTPLLGPLHEPETTVLLDLAAPYLPSWFNAGEATMTIGKTIELCHQGCQGVINVMPFSCMPSTVAQSMLKKVAPALRGMPALTIAYDGQQDPTLETRLEAFLAQARMCQPGGPAA
jgi:predicted CoA-substrate-specific enzyme activase